MSSSSALRLVPLHGHDQYRDRVVELLNDEWPQSRTIRLRRLERSCDALPLSYVLLDPASQLLGYCYVDRLFDDEHSAIVESVCIQRALRGHGYGRMLMELLEGQLRDRSPSIAQLYLTTTDKRQFYERCGYEETSPRVRLNISSKLFNGNEEALRNLLANQQQATADTHVILQKGSTIQRIPTVWMKKHISLA